MDEITFALLVKLVRLVVGIVGFIGLLSLDAWKAWRSKAHWVPQGALILSAFSIQLLGLLDTDNVSISDYPQSKEYDLNRVLRNELLIDGGRVMVCVYMGYLLPEMARSPSKRMVWNDIGALALSLGTHIVSEIYVFNELYWKVWEDYNITINPMSIVSRLCTGLCALSLFLLLGSAAFAGRTLHNLVREKIPLVLKMEAQDVYSQRYVEKSVLHSWAVAWVCRPDYIITRSVLASSVGMVVTVSVGCFLAECITQNYKVLHFYDGIDWFRYVVMGFMGGLILMGWSIIFIRWRRAIIFYIPSEDKKLFHVEDFWTRHIFEVMEDIDFSQTSWDRRVSGGGFLDNLKLRFLKTLRVHIFLRRPLLCLQRYIIHFSKLCWCLSEVVFLGKFSRPSKLVRDVDPPELIAAFEKVRMPGESPQCLFRGSRNAIKQIKSFMEKGRRDGKKSDKLIGLLNNACSDQNSAGKLFLEALRDRLKLEYSRFDYLTKLSWKMTALSLIQLMIELNNHEAAKNALKAYSQAYDFLDLLDNSAGTATDSNDNPELLVRAADKQFIVMERNLLFVGAADSTENSTMPAQEPKDSVDSVDWWKVAVNNSLRKVRKTIKVSGTYSMESIQMLFADMLAIALKEKVRTALVDNCRKWAEMVEDEKIRASVYIAGKLGGVDEEVIKSNGGLEAADPSTCCECKCGKIWCKIYCGRCHTGTSSSQQ